MDIVLESFDQLVFNQVYPEWLHADNIWRQLATILFILNVGTAFLYIIPASLNYFFIFDKRLLKHPLILKDQIRREIQYSLWAIPFVSLPTAAVVMLEVRGYSKLYVDVHSNQLGWFAIVLEVVSFILFTDCLIYWIHRGLHHRLIYKYMHKDHHIWKVPTPFASLAIHPIDGFLQSCPQLIYPFIFPLHKYTYLFMFSFVNLWSISIHDCDYRMPEFLKPYISGSAHHTDHHLFFNYNYGAFFTFWDRIGNSFRKPSAWDGDSPLAQVLAGAQVPEGDNKKKDSSKTD